MKTFERLGLSAEILRAIAAEGYTKPTPVQAATIPHVLAGRDVLACAQTGTGKTAAFTLPLLHQLQHSPREHARRIRTLVVTPTRELAAQVESSIKTYGQHLPIRAAVVFGGVGIQPQIRLLRRGVDILVATPGRLLDLANQGELDLSHIQCLVLDEADRMLDMGFIHDIRRIMKLLPEKRQTLLFSATFSKELKRLAGRILRHPEHIEIARNETSHQVEQRVHPVGKSEKRALLAHLIHTGNWRQVLVFTKTKHGANRLSRQLDDDGIKTTAIHGNKSQTARTKALKDFKAGRVRVLVATDIAARGLDIEQLPHVINFELPHVPEDYVHRIGRTGRAGHTGEAVSLVCAEEAGLLHGIERLIQSPILQQVVPGFEPDRAWSDLKDENVTRSKRRARIKKSAAKRENDRGRGAGRPRQGRDATP
ncbi:MAG: DEAD/DEAH box helicase [Zetaproteobacteria bacterium]|nr:MAG: DEAD/DEAH box helicase [Zetaproteobacteria bacterium]